jgi:agmatine deiminase
MHAANLFGCTPLRSQHLVLEGGSIESDGRGTILTTSACLLSPNRNPGLTKAQIERQMLALFGARRMLWLDHGHMEGDDTDAHVDTLARLAPGDTIVYVACDDRTDAHYADLKAMEDELKALRTAAGKPYRLLPLPWPAAKFDEDGNRLPATYANFLVLNGAVLAPTYRDKADAVALKVIGKAFPGHDIIGIDCTPLIGQHGSLHCVTMQIPKGACGSVSSAEAQERGE